MRSAEVISQAAGSRQQAAGSRQQAADKQYLHLPLAYRTLQHPPTRPQQDPSTPHIPSQAIQTPPSALTHQQQHLNPSSAIPSVEAGMLQVLQKTHNQFRNLEGLVLGLIREEYEKKGWK